jgi:Mu-like prophage I protein
MKKPKKLVLHGAPATAGLSFNEVIDSEGKRFDGPALADSREGLIAEAKAGKINRLRFTATTCASVPNAKHIRFSDDFEEFAASFAGVPFQRDHDHGIEARGGTVLRSWAVPREGQPDIFEMKQLIEARKDWAVLGVLDGTIDRFSVGFRSQRYECSICGEKIDSTECSHWPGKEYRGRTCEVLCKGSSGVETSAVVSPAVPGTGIDAISELSEFIHDLRAEGPPEEKEKAMDKILAKFRVILGLDDTAGEEQIESKIEELRAKHGILTRLAALVGVNAEAGASEVEARLAAAVNPKKFVSRDEYDKLVAEMTLAKARKKIDAALAEGKLTAKQAEAGGWAEQFALATPEAFDQFLAEQVAAVPIQKPAPKGASGSGVSLSEPDREVLRAMGIDEKKYLEFCKLEEEAASKA